MASQHVTTASGKVEAYPLSQHARLGTLPRHFGVYMMTVEGRVFDLMREYSAHCSAGCWRFYGLSNRGYMAPPIGRVWLSVPGNGYRGEMFGDAAGITVCLFTFSQLSFEIRPTEVFTRHFHWLREFAWRHAERGRFSRRSTEGKEKAPVWVV